MKIIASLFRPHQPPVPSTRDGKASLPRTQSADKMLKTLREAEKLGLRTRLDDQNNLSLQETRSPSLWGRFKMLFERKPVGIENRDAIVSAVVTRMKDQIGQSTRHVDSVMTRHLPDLGRFAQTGEIGHLQDQWASLQNILRRGIEVHEQAQAARKDLMSPSPSPAATSAAASAPVTNPTKAATVTTPPAARPTGISRPKPLQDATRAAQRIAEANRSLPAAMPTMTSTGQPVRCTLTVSEQRQQGMFNDWRDWRVHEKSTEHKGSDPFVGLSEAFSKDANRATYIFESGGFAIECERDREGVALGFKEAVGKNPMRQQILSHLLGQEALKRMLETIQKAHLRPDGLPFFLGGASDPTFTRHQLHMTVQDNGDVDIAYLSLMKSTHLVGDPGLLDINRSARFDGEPSRDNAGLCLSMKIRLPNGELNRGQLLFNILEPLQVTLQVELPETLTDE